MLNGKKLYQTDSVKYLGFHLDKNQINNQTSKVAIKLIKQM